VNTCKTFMTSTVVSRHKSEWNAFFKCNRNGIICFCLSCARRYFLLHMARQFLPVLVEELSGFFSVPIRRWRLCKRNLWRVREVHWRSGLAQMRVQIWLPTQRRRLVWRWVLKWWRGKMRSFCFSHNQTKLQSLCARF